MVPHIAHNEADAWEQIEELTICANCVHFKRQHLFGGQCSYLRGNVSNGECCEAFYGYEKRINYWVNKLVEMAMAYSGENDFYKQLDYHQANGTDYKFLFDT